jgi:hypothetical protein
MRPQRNSFHPEAIEASPESRRIDPDLIEWVLTLSRHSIIAAAFALVERGVDTHAIAVDPTGGRAVLPADAIEAAEKLFDDHRESLPPPSQSDSVLSYRKRLAHSLSFFGISPSDASALVTLTVELGCFPDFWSKNNPPPRGLARQELQNTPDELMKSAAKLLFDAFYAEQYPNVDALLRAFIPTAPSSS